MITNSSTYRDGGTKVFFGEFKFSEKIYDKLCIDKRMISIGNGKCGPVKTFGKLWLGYPGSKESLYLGEFDTETLKPFLDEIEKYELEHVNQ